MINFLIFSPDTAREILSLKRTEYKKQECIIPEHYLERYWLNTMCNAKQSLPTGVHNPADGHCE